MLVPCTLEFFKMKIPFTIWRIWWGLMMQAVSHFTSFYPSSLAGGIENKVQVLDFGMFNVMPKIYQRMMHIYCYIYIYIFTRMLNSFFMNSVKKKFQTNHKSLHLPRGITDQWSSIIWRKSYMAYRRTNTLKILDSPGKSPRCLYVWLSTSISSLWYVHRPWSIHAKASTYCCGLDDFFANHLGLRLHIIST